MKNKEFKNKLYEECPELHLMQLGHNLGQEQEELNNYIYQKNKTKIFNLIEKEIDAEMRKAVQDTV